jgi:hypothetical protein
MIFQNRKKDRSIGGIISIPFAVIIFLAPTLCLGYLSLENRCEALGKELKALESVIDNRHRQCQYEESQWMRVKSPAEIDRALHRYGIQMSWPSEKQIVRMNAADLSAAFASDVREGHGQFAQVRKIRTHD